MLFRPGASVISSQLAPLFGFLGVEALLVLGGFLIGKKIYALVVLEDEFSLQNVFSFIKKIAFRFLPLYFLVLVLVFLISIFFHHPTADVWKYFLFIQNFYHPMPVFFSESWPIPIGLFGSGSLLLGMCLILKKIGSCNKSNLFLGYTLAMIALFCGCKYYYYLGNGALTLLAWDQHLRSVVMYRLDSFYIGVLGAWMYFNRSSFWVPNRKWFLLFGIFLMLLLFVGVGYFGWLIKSQPFFWEVVYFPLTSISIGLFLPFLSCIDLQQSMLGRSFSFLSSISYGLFLLHYSLLLQIMIPFCPIEGTSTGGFLILSTIFIVLALGMSAVLHRFYEKPLAKFGTKN